MRQGLLSSPLLLTRAHTAGVRNLILQMGQLRVGEGADLSKATHSLDKVWQGVSPACCLSSCSAHPPDPGAQFQPFPIQGSSPTPQEAGPTKKPALGREGPHPTPLLVISMLGVHISFSAPHKRLSVFPYSLDRCGGDSSHTGWLARRGCSGEKWLPTIPGKAQVLRNSSANKDSTAASDGSTQRCPLPPVSVLGLLEPCP